MWIERDDLLSVEAITVLPAGLIGLAHEDAIEPGEWVLFLRSGGLPSLCAYEAQVLERRGVAP